MLLSQYKLNTNESNSVVFKIGDWVYCEFEPTQPYSIRRIEELVQVNDQLSVHLMTTLVIRSILLKKPDGSVEAKLRCAFRRSDIPSSLLLSLEKRYSQYFNKDSGSTTSTQLTLSNHHTSSNRSLSLEAQDSDGQKTYSYLPSTEHLTSLQIYRLKHRELFYSRYFEANVPVDGIFKGKLDLSNEIIL